LDAACASVASEISRTDGKSSLFSEPIIGSMQEVREGAVSQSVDGPSNET
jgi:hypothetical protein